MTNLKRIFFTCLIFIFYIEDLKSQCSMCKAIAEEEVEEDGATGINAGILYMMAIPYIIVFIVFRKPIIAFFKKLFSKTEKKSA